MRFTTKLAYYLCLSLALAASLSKDYAAASMFLCGCILLNQTEPKPS
jgi:hypothetical protein